MSSIKLTNSSLPLELGVVVGTEEVAVYLVALALHLKRASARVTLEAGEMPEVFGADDQEVHVVDEPLASDA